MKVLLFDIDGTLIDSAGAGMAALQAAARKFFGAEGPPLDLAGSTDEGVVRRMMAHFDEEPTRERIDGFYEAYLPELRARIFAEDYTGYVYDGAEEAVAALAARTDEYLCGLLTGNIEGGGWAKVEAHGMEGFFQFGSWGSDHWDRNELGPIALERAGELVGRTFSGSDAVVIGDTPKDIACARACGAKVVAVTTGHFTREALADADAVIDSLAELEAVLATF